MNHILELKLEMCRDVHLSASMSLLEVAGVDRTRTPFYDDGWGICTVPGTLESTTYKSNLRTSTVFRTARKEASFRFVQTRKSTARPLTTSLTLRR